MFGSQSSFLHPLEVEMLPEGALPPVTNQPAIQQLWRGRLCFSDTEMLPAEVLRLQALIEDVVVPVTGTTSCVAS